MSSDTGNAAREMRAWEKEVFYNHRWGRHGARAGEEHKSLMTLYRAAGPLGEPLGTIVDQIVALEICNWNLEESIIALCGAIGAHKPATLPIGHLASCDAERWKRVWAYYLACRKWLRGDGPAAYRVHLASCDEGGLVERHINELLGERTRLKEYCVERFCLCLEFWLDGFPPAESVHMKSHAAAVAIIEEEISRLEPESEILAALRNDGDGTLQPCHHKAFRRYDIILSSIGAGKWRATMPVEGTGAAERVALVERFLAPVEAWAMGAGDGPGDDLGRRVYDLLGAPDDVKLFLASLLVSLIRSQQLTAQEKADKGRT